MNEGIEILGESWAEVVDLRYGIGRPVPGRAKAPIITLNSPDKPPPRTDRWTGSRCWARASWHDFERHLVGEVPLFTASAANRVTYRLADPVPLEHLFTAAGLADAEADAEVRRALAGGSGALTRAKLLKFLSRSPGPRPANLSHAAATVWEYLAALPRRSDSWWAARRLIERASEAQLHRRRWALVTIDIDGDGTAEGAANAADLAAAVVFEILSPLDIPAIVEPSRSRTGAYLRWYLRLADANTAKFNGAIDRLQTHLRMKFDRTATSRAWACSVKGRLTWWAANPEFDAVAAARPASSRWTEQERYEWLRRHHGTPHRLGPVVWTHRPELEPLSLCGPQGDLITAPLHGLAADADGGVRRVADLVWLREQREHRAPTAEAWFASLGLWPEDEAPVVAPTTSPAPTRPSPSTPSRPAPALADLPQPTGHDLARITGDDGWLSYVAAGRYALRATRGDVEAAAHLARDAREQLDAVTGMTESDRAARLEDSRRCVEFAARTYDPALAGGGGSLVLGAADVEAMRQQLERLVPTYLLRWAHERRPEATVSMSLLAAYMVALQKAMHTDAYERGSAPQRLLRQVLERHTGTKLHPRTTAALLGVLNEAGLVKVARRHRKGVCRIYLLSRSAPLIDRVAALPAATRCVEPRVTQVDAGLLVLGAPPAASWDCGGVPLHHTPPDNVVSTDSGPAGMESSRTGPSRDRAGPAAGETGPPPLNIAAFAAFDDSIYKLVTPSVRAGTARNFYEGRTA